MDRVSSWKAVGKGSFILRIPAASIVGQQSDFVLLCQMAEYVIRAYLAAGVYRQQPARFDPENLHGWVEACLVGEFAGSPVTSFPLRARQAEVTVSISPNPKMLNRAIRWIVLFIHCSRALLHTDEAHLCN
jgi:hypothetical protein